MGILADLYARKPLVYEVSVLGDTIKVSPITMQQAADLEQFVQGNFPSPLQSIKAELETVKSEEDRDRLLGLAVEGYESGSWPPQYLAPSCMTPLLETYKGKAAIIAKAFERHHPDYSQDTETCMSVAIAIPNEEFVRLIAAFHGKNPDDPKYHSAGLSETDPQIGMLLLAYLASSVLGQNSAK